MQSPITGEVMETRLRGVTGVALNVWFKSPENFDGGGWRMTLYPDTKDGIYYDKYFAIEPSRAQVRRYLEIVGGDSEWEDDDWWSMDWKEIDQILYGRSDNG